MRMKKTSLLITMVLTLALILGVGPYIKTIQAAETSYERVIDQADLLTAEEEQSLISLYDKISSDHNFDVTVVTLESINGQEPSDAAWSVYREAGYGQGINQDGVILLISMEERDWAIEAAGYGEKAINEDARNYISDKIVSDLSAGNYYDSFMAFGNLCDEMLTRAEGGKPYRKPFGAGFALLISLLTGLVGGGGTVAAMRSSLKSVHSSTGAAQYVQKNSFKLTDSRDRFLYRNVTRRARPKSDSSSRSGGGGHSGSHGKF